MIDQVWTAFISQGEIYENFWKKVFGGYVDRRHPSSANEDPNMNYSTTLRLLEIHRSLVDPHPNLWPKYESEDHNYESKYYVHIPSEVVKNLESNNRHYIDLCKAAVSVHKWKSAWEYLHKSLTQDSDVSPSSWEFAEIQVKLFDGSSLLLKNLYKRIKRWSSKVSLQLLNRITIKYWISENTAAVWLEEFHRYLMIMCHLGIEKQKFVPSLVIEKVWKTYAEFTIAFRDLWEQLFGEVIYCPPFQPDSEDFVTKLETVRKLWIKVGSNNGWTYRYWRLTNNYYL